MMNINNNKWCRHCKLVQGKQVKLRVQQDTSQILFSSVPAQRRARHAFVPRWHFDMLQDELRNSAYDKAITRVSLPCPCHVVQQAPPGVGVGGGYRGGG